MNASGLIRNLFLWALFLQSIGQLRPAVMWLAERAAKEQHGFISLGQLNRALVDTASKPHGVGH